METKRAKGKRERRSVRVEPRSADELSRFFQVNKERYGEFWVVLTKKKHADPQPVSGYEALTEAIRHGLIDSRTRSLGQEKYEMRFTRRLPGSRWSEVNLRILEGIKEEKRKETET